MPNNKKSSRRRRGGRRLAVDAPKRVTVGRPLPNAFTTTMVYTNYFALTEPAATVGAFNVFSVNDLYDPDFSSTGAQPIGYDQWSQFYSRMRVVSYRANFQFVNTTSAPCVVGWMAQSASTPTSDNKAWAGQGFADSKLISGNTAGNSTASFSVSIPLWDIMSITKRQYMDEQDYSQVVGAGPVRRVYLTPWVRGFGSAASVTIAVRLDFKVELSQLNPLGLS